MRSICIGCFVFALTLSLPAPAASTDPFLFVTTTDFTTGSSSTLATSAPYAATLNVASVNSDAVAKVYDELIYVVNRGSNEIKILDPNAAFATVDEIFLGAGSNPHDIVVVSPTKAYVSRYDGTTLAIIDPAAGSVTGSIDLSAWSDVDGLPEIDSMARVGNHVFVTVQRLDRNNFSLPVGTSYVVVIDITTDALVDVDAVASGTQAIPLTGTNPFSSLEFPYSGQLYVSCVGVFGVPDGGVELVDPASLQSGGYMLTESAAGGDIVDVEIVGPDHGYVVISDVSFNTVLKDFDPQTGMLLGTVFNPGGYVLYDIEESPVGGELFVADRAALNPGIRIFDVTNNTQLTGSPISTDLPPFDLTFSTPVVTGVGDTPAAGATLGPNYPNPFNPSTTIPFSIEHAGRVRLDIYSPRGARVRTLVDGVRPAGPGTATWDGRDAAGQPAPTGVYFVRMKSDGRTISRKIVLLK